MRPTSFISRGDTVDLRIRNMALLAKPQIEITLNEATGSHSGYISSYSTLDKIEGCVTVISKNDAKFDDIEITLTGLTKTFVDKLGASPAVNGRSNASHKFLRIEQPISEESLPIPRMIEAGKTYTFPFTFVIPEQLLPRPCPHAVENEHVHQMHHQLPPSLGDPDLSGYGGKLLDDMAPDMAKISYAINAKLTRIRESDLKEIVVADASKKLRIKPSFPEQPPLTVSEEDNHLRLRQEKTIKKGLFSGKLGRLVVESAQPKSFHLPARAEDGSFSHVTSTSATVNLRFDPADEDHLPPKLGMLSTRLKSTTFFATLGQRSFPKKEMTLLNSSQGAFSMTVPLASRCVESVQWEKHEGDKANGSLHRRDSGVSISGELAPSSAYQGGSYYTANVLVPLTLPTSKQIVPTFHTCLVSRIYSLNLNLSVQGQGVGGASFALKIPVQVSAAGSAAAEQRRASREQEQELQLLAEFEPRNIAPPPAEYLGTGGSFFGNSYGQEDPALRPPEYEFYSRAVPGAGALNAGMQMCG